MLQILTKENYDDLTIIRKIRNEFAHSTEFVNFDSPEIHAHLKRFTTFEAGETDRRGYYLRKLREIDTHLDHVINTADQVSTANHPPSKGAA